MNKKKLLLCCGVFAGCLLSAYAFSAWLLTPLPPLAETQEPVLLENGHEVPCDPFGDFALNRKAMVAKYEGKTVRLSGIADLYRSCDGANFRYCAGPRGTTFCLSEPGREQTLVKIHQGNRIIANVTLDTNWTDSLGYFDNTTVWRGEIQEIQELVSGRFSRRWKTIWKRD